MFVLTAAEVCGSPPSDRPPPPRSSATSGPERRLISDMLGLRVYRCVGLLFVAGRAPSATTLPTAAPPVVDRALARLEELPDDDLGSPVSLFCVSEVRGRGSYVGKAPRRAGEPLATRRPPFCFARRPALVQTTSPWICLHGAAPIW